MNTIDKAIRICDTSYKITKIDVRTEKEQTYNTMSEEEVKAILKGYKFNGLFYEKKNSNYIYTVEKK